MNIFYYSLVESRLRYGISAWGSSVKTYINKLGIIEKRFIKIIFNKPNTYPSDDLHAEAGFLDLRQLYFQFKNKDKLVKVDHYHFTKSKFSLFRTLFSCKSIGQRNHLYQGPRFYFLVNNTHISGGEVVDTYLILLILDSTKLSSNYYTTFIDRYDTM